jgi:hypothetical protein
VSGWNRPVLLGTTVVLFFRKLGGDGLVVAVKSMLED